MRTQHVCALHDCHRNHYHGGVPPKRKSSTALPPARATKPERPGGGLTSIGLTSVDEFRDGTLTHRSDELAVEEPLQIMLGRRPLAVTMRTPGHDLELAAGFLFTEGVIASFGEIASLAHTTTGPASQRRNTVRVRLAKSAASGASTPRRYFAASSSCGVCGKSSIDSIRRRGIRKLKDEFAISPALLCLLPDRMRTAQTVFSHTGGLHAAAVFNAQGELLVLREDIGRHNAVDKIIGWALQQDEVPLRDHILVVSGRGGFEIVQKAVTAGIPIIASISAPSTLAVQLAREFGATLIGFLRGGRFVLYSRPERIAAKP